MTALRFRYIGWIAGLFVAMASPDLAGQSLPRMMMAQCSVDSTDAAITVGKAEAALALAVGLSGQVEYVPTAVRDSLVRAAQVPQAQLTAIGAATLVNAKLLVFMTMRRLHHLVRTELIVIDVTSPSTQRRGVGYATLRHHHSDETVLADPAMLSSTQRAFAVAMGDSTMYIKTGVDSAFHVRPTHLTAIGGFPFRNDPTAQPWELFKQKVAVSYDLAQSVAHGLANAEGYTVVDIETRDSMYAMLGLHLTENYNDVSAIELQQLSRFEVTHLVSGSLQRTDKGAMLTLTLNRILQDERYTALRSVEELVEQDTKIALRDAIERAVGRLLGSD